VKLGFTGTQEGATLKQVEAFSKFFGKYLVDEFHHGDCVGADAQAHSIACSWHTKNIIIHPPIKTVKRAYCEKLYTFDEKHTTIVILEPKDYLDRNKDIVDACDVLIACPKTSKEELRSGTWSTVRYARKRNKKIIILEP
jgi:hypothetical protein